MSNYKKGNEIIADINRYLTNKMSNKERYEFERLLERDPFLEEAVEGLSDFKLSEIEKDLNAINLLSGKRSLKIKPVIYFILAAFILLTIVFIGFINQPEIKTSEIKAKNERLKKVVKRDTLLFVSKEIFHESTDTTDTLITDENLIEKSEIHKIEEQFESINKKETEIKSPKKNTLKTDNLIASAVKSPQKTISVKIAEPKIDDELIKTSNEQNRQKINVDTKNLQAVSNENAIKETEIVDLTQQDNTKNKDNSIQIRVGVNADAQPLGGMNLYSSYLENNLQYPVSEHDQQREIVRLKFEITSTGIPTNFTIIKAPENNDFSKEAIRLVKDGPKWSPAIKDGNPIQEEISLRIVFKPSK